MPGTVMLDAYEMPIEDAMAILLTGKFPRDAYPYEIDELRRVARSIVEAHAEEVVRCCVPRLNPHPKSSEFLRVVT